MMLPLVYPLHPDPRAPQVEAAIQDFWEQRVEEATYTQAEVTYGGNLYWTGQSECFAYFLRGLDVMLLLRSWRF